MNLKSEQLTIDNEVLIDFDMPLNTKQIIKLFKIEFGNISNEGNYGNNKYIEISFENQKVIILFAAVTYLGGNGQHPVFKKRIQLKKWFKEIIQDANYSSFKFKILGVYHYNLSYVFVDFDIPSYIDKKMNNSAAHVYINDLFKANEDGLFHKIDRNNNKITTISYDRLKSYILGNDITKKQFELEVIQKFNKYIDKSWILANQAILSMKDNDFSNWAQAEWQGWFLEFEFNKFLEKNKIISISFTNSLIKDDSIFDLFLNNLDFYADLKTSDSSKKQTLANDKSKLIESLNAHNKFWYIVYEHETILDKNNDEDFSATKFMNRLKFESGKWPRNKSYNELSYGNKMKHSIKFKNMFVLEINKSNYIHILNEFNQGRQSSGESRKPKFLIDKKNIDNYLIYKENLT